METRRLITMMLFCFAIIFGWQILYTQVLAPKFNWKLPGQANVDPATTAPSTDPSTTAPSTTTVATAPGVSTTGATVNAAPASTAPVNALRIVAPATQPTSVTLGGDAPKFAMSARLTSIGAAIDSVALPKFKAPDAKSQYVFQTPYDESNPATRSLATRSITVNGTTLDIAGANWILDTSDAKSATFVLDLGLVKLRKIYEVTEATDPGKGFELLVKQTIENTSGAAVTASLQTTGPTAPPRENERGPDIQMLTGYDGGYERVVVGHHMVDEFGVKSPEMNLTTNSSNQPLLWYGASSVYFEGIVRPIPLEQGAAIPKWVGKLNAEALNPQADPHERHVILTFNTTDLKIEPGTSTTLASSNFFGPRWRKVLNEPFYSQFPLSYNNSLVLTSGPCGFCTFTVLINGLVRLLEFFHMIFRDWGLSIIALVVLVRLILHPITKRSQISMLRMGKMGPEMERIKQKYKDDKDELNRQMMLVYKEQGIGPYLGCLPMFLQMPIWIALWSALQSTFELRQSPFLYGIFGHWMSDLAKPDRLISWTPIHIPLPLFGTVTLSSLNILPLCMGVVFFLQQKFTPQPPSTTPEQEMQKKMMLWMSVLLFPLFLYSGPSGLNLYIMTSTTIGIIESKRIRDHIKQREEAEKAGKIIVDAPRGMKKREEPAQKPKAEAPKTGFAGWIEQMKAKAAEIQKQADKDRK